MGEFTIPVKAVKHVAGHVQVSEQLLYDAPPRQLRFEGDPNFKPSPFVAAFDLEMRRAFAELRHGLNAPSLLFSTAPRHIEQRLFERAPSCNAGRSVGEDWLSCNLDEGHTGPHYDGYERLEWSERG